MWLNLTFGPSFKTRQGYPNLKVLITHLLLVIEFLECETDLQQIMGWASFAVVRFDIGPLLQGQMRIAKLKSAIIPVNNFTFS